MKPNAADGTFSTASEGLVPKSRWNNHESRAQVVRCYPLFRMRFVPGDRGRQRRSPSKSSRDRELHTQIPDGTQDSTEQLELCFHGCSTGFSGPAPRRLLKKSHLRRSASSLVIQRTGSTLHRYMDPRLRGGMFCLPCIWNFLNSLQQPLIQRAARGPHERAGRLATSSPVTSLSLARVIRRS